MREGERQKKNYTDEQVSRLAYIGHGIESTQEDADRLKLQLEELLARIQEKQEELRGLSETEDPQLTEVRREVTNDIAELEALHGDMTENREAYTRLSEHLKKARQRFLKMFATS